MPKSHSMRGRWKGEDEQSDRSFCLKFFFSSPPSSPRLPSTRVLPNSPPRSFSYSLNSFPSSQGGPKPERSQKGGREKLTPPRKNRPPLEKSTPSLLPLVSRGLPQGQATHLRPRVRVLEDEGLRFFLLLLSRIVMPLAPFFWSTTCRLARPPPSSCHVLCISMMFLFFSALLRGLARHVGWPRAHPLCPPACPLRNLNCSLLEFSSFPQYFAFVPAPYPPFGPDSSNCPLIPSSSTSPTLLSALRSSSKSTMSASSALSTTSASPRRSPLTSSVTSGRATSSVSPVATTSRVSP